MRSGIERLRNRSSNRKGIKNYKNTHTITHTVHTNKYSCKCIKFNFISSSAVAATAAALVILYKFQQQ